MSTTIPVDLDGQPPDPAGFPWLPLADVLDELGQPSEDKHDSVNRARIAAATHVRRVRPDLFVGGAVPTDGDVILGAILLTARLYARKGSPTGLASYGEFGPAAVLRFDPDVERLLGVGRYAAPTVG